MRRLIPGMLIAYLATLRFPVLFGITALVFLADMLLPDLIPFADEILLGLGTALLGYWKRKAPATDCADASPHKGTRQKPPKH